MKLRSIIALAFGLWLSVASALAQTSPGTSPLSIAKGGTNAATAAAARTNLGLAIGSAVQAWDADLDALAALGGTNTIYYRSGANTWTAVTIGGMLSFSGGTLNVGDPELAALAGLTSAADKCFYFTGSGTASTLDCPSWSRAVISAASASAGRIAFGLAIGTDVQAYDAELAALAGLTSANNKCFYWTGTGTAATFDCSSFGRAVANTADAAALRLLAGAVIGTNVQAWDADLDAYAALSSAGIVARTGAGTVATRTITAPAAGFSVSNGDGVAGNPTFALTNDLAALEGLSSTGYGVRTGSDAWAQRTFAAGTGLGVTNGDGVSGNTSYAVTDAELLALAGLTSAADSCVYFTGSGTAALASCPTYGRSLFAAVDAATARSTLGLGTSATVNTGTSGATIPLLNGNNAWSGAQDLQGALTVSGDISPTQIVANTNDYAPTGFSTATAIRLSTDASRNITGLAGGADGRVIIIHNVGAFPAVLINASGSSSSANQFLFGGDVTLGADTSITLRYDATSTKWRAITSPGAGGGGGGGVTSVGITAGTGLSSSGTCTITTSGTCVLDMANTITAGGPTGSSTSVPVITYNARGQLTTVSTATISSAGQLVSVVTYSSTQTITIPAGATKAIVKLSGGSGGGGGATNGSGSGAGALQKYLSSLTPGNTLALTIGAGGTSTPGAGAASTLASGTQSITTLTANGGGAGSATAVVAGGTASNGDHNITGGPGVSTSSGTYGGYPGGPVGFGLGFGGTAQSGGQAGTAGICIIEWYS